MQPLEEIEDMVTRLTSPKPLPESAIQDPSRRRTEIYMRDERHKATSRSYTSSYETMPTSTYSRSKICKLKKPKEPPKPKLKKKVNELIAANAATQATVTAMAAESATIKALLTQLVQAQQGANAKTAKTTDTEHSTATGPATEPKTETETEPNTDQNTELTTEMELMGVLLSSNDTILTVQSRPTSNLFIH